MATSIEQSLQFNWWCGELAQAGREIPESWEQTLFKAGLEQATTWLELEHIEGELIVEVQQKVEGLDTPVNGWLCRGKFWIEGVQR